LPVFAHHELGEVPLDFAAHLAGQELV